MKGQCLCGQVAFELSGKIPALYQCHCSLCRRVSGSSANAALVIDAAQFSWVRGEERIQRYRRADGWKSHFCRECGSPVPNSSREGRAFWVPVGLLEDDPSLRLGAHLYLASRAHWDVVADHGSQFDEMPDSAALDELLGRA